MKVQICISLYIHGALCKNSYHFPLLKAEVLAETLGV